MKPKALAFPFSWEERRPLIRDRVFYVPPYYFAHGEFCFPSWESSELFSNTNPVFVEYCSGNGDWLVRRALEDRACNWIAVEKRFDRVRKIWSKVKNASLGNVFIVCGDALTFTKNYLPSRSIQAVHVNFPDPWPKEKHAKHRLIQSPFVSEIERILQAKGSILLVTDDVDYSQQMIEQMQKNPAFFSKFAFPFYTKKMENYGDSWFKELWESKGKEIRYMQFELKKIGAGQ